MPRSRTRVEDVPLVQGLRPDQGWVDMDVQLLIDEASAGSHRLVFGRSVLRPGAKHDRHRHLECDEFVLVMSGSGLVHTNEGMEPARAGDVIFTPAGDWHGFDNTSDGDVELLWGWAGAGSLAASGYEVAPAPSE
ncbi:MAG TPA: cupin domain-containing protein [Gaiellaceae bacterium]|jgi:quercetin dioxygenase-like cupin family protein